MADKLESVKRWVSQRHLGQHGIHAVGIGELDRTVRLYVSSRAALDASGILDDIQNAAAPFKVVVVEEHQAMLADDAGKPDDRSL